MIKKIISLVLLAVIMTCMAASNLSFAQEEKASSKMVPILVDIHGVVSDSLCKLDHGAMIKSGQYGKNEADCVHKCEQQGMKLVLVERKTNEVYGFVNENEAKPFAGRSVVVVGQIDKASKVIRIHSIKAERSKAN